MDTKLAVGIGDTLLSEAGIVAYILFFALVASNGLWVWLYKSEKRDRREAWKSYNELAKNTNDVLLNLTTVIEVIRDRIK